MKPNTVMTLIGLSVGLGLLGLISGMIYSVIEPSFEDTMQKILMIVILILGIIVILLFINEKRIKNKTSKQNMGAI